jgi:hypothetical protein
MTESFLTLLAILLAVYLWHNALGARELARLQCHELCARANVQLLDQTIALCGLRLIRIPGLGLRLRRDYRFEISIDGQDRHRGSLSLLDGHIMLHTLPLAANPATPPATNVVAFAPRNPSAPSIH